jgi:hypothetical protein
MLIFDRDGSGAESKTRETIESEVEAELQASGWAVGTVSVIVIEPELEAWVWATSPRVADALGWHDDPNGLQPFLAQSNLWEANCSKPSDPKEAMKRALRKVQKPLTARIFADLASRVGVSQCQDAAFGKFRDTLRQWFPV